MKQILLLICCLAITSTAFGQQYDTLTEEFLRPKVRNLKSIQPNEVSTIDLAFLKEELEEVEILLLGEQGHGNGSAFLAKTRLIKYLHEQMGFNVLAFESGLMDCYRVWEAIQQGADSLGVFHLGVFPVWAKSEQVQPLFEYILEQSKTENPLILAGFDMQPTGTISPDKRFKELSDYLDGLLGMSWKGDYPMLADFYQNTRKVFGNPFTGVQEDSLLNEAKALSKSVFQKDHSTKGKVVSRYLLDYHATIQLFSKADMQNPANTPHVFNARDKRMAENFELIKEMLYPGEKIIAWGANTHFGAGRGLLGSFNGTEAPQQGMVPAGQYLKIDYQDKVYAMAFTSYEGQYGMLNREPFDLPPADPATLEYQLKTMGVEYGFISLRHPEFSGKRFITTFYGHTPMSGKWSVMADGIFFIRYMEASRFK